MNKIDEIKLIIKNSGNSFHVKVINYLKNNGWTALVSPYYTDTNTNKPREIDIVAEKEYNVDNGFGGVIGTINVKLFIECKYINKNTVFWFDKKDLEKADSWVINNTPHKNNSIYKEKHHYLDNEIKVAKLFAGPSKRNLENEDIYRALNQCLNAIVCHRHQGSIISSKRNQILHTTKYPIIVCNSFNNFYKVDIDKESNPKNINKNFPLEVNYAYLDMHREHRTEYFLIDIVEYNKIDDFLSIIQQDVNSIKNVINDDIR